MVDELIETSQVISQVEKQMFWVSEGFGVYEHYIAGM